MTIRVFRVTISDHTAHFDDLDVATAYIRGCLNVSDGFPPITEQQVSLESIVMNEEEYRVVCEAEETKLT